MKITDPAYNYDLNGQKYSGQRKTEPRIASHIFRALADAKTVLNIGAGAGSYEPADRYVIAVEPSSVMRMQRAKNNSHPAITGTADHLPFDDNSFDASMAILTVHHWPDIEKGLQEIRRVTRNQVVIMTFDPDSLYKYWNAEYFPEVIKVERQRYPAIERLLRILGGKTILESIPVPLDCADGFQEAFYGRPEAFLNSEVRKAQSAWGFIPYEDQEKIVERLRSDLQSGVWDKKYGHFRSMPEYTCALRLITAVP
jgi:SAM-dependent methyltransferase